MECVERISLIDKNKLNEAFYFESLIEEAYRSGLLNEADIEKIQFMCLELLENKIKKFTSGDSSSVRIEAAENIMKSNLYTIGLFLKSFPCPDDAIKTIKESSISELYSRGRKIIKIKLNSAKFFHAIVIKNMIETENYTYSLTVVDGIIGFFKIYNADYDSREIHITADYPTCNPVGNFVGIEFIQKYLESIHYENIFCGCFSNNAIHHLLCGYDENYKELIFNIYEQVLTSAIGCILAGTEAINLNISHVQLELLHNILEKKSRAEVEVEIVKAYHKLIAEVDLTSLHTQTYIKKTLPIVVANVYSAVKINALERVFYEPKYPEMNQRIYVSFGEKMDNKEYRRIIDEIIECRFISDKIAIIKEKIHSLADLEDLLLDAELEANEITSVLKELGLDIAEISALAKRYPYKSDIEAIDLKESEQTLCLCLHKYIISLSQVKQLDIAKTISLLEE